MVEPGEELPTRTEKPERSKKRLRLAMGAAVLGLAAFFGGKVAPEGAAGLLAEVGVAPLGSARVGAMVSGEKDQMYRGLTQEDVETTENVTRLQVTIGGTSFHVFMGTAKAGVGGADRGLIIRVTPAASGG